MSITRMRITVKKLDWSDAYDLGRAARRVKELEQELEQERDTYAEFRNKLLVTDLPEGCASAHLSDDNEYVVYFREGV